MTQEEQKPVLLPEACLLHPRAKELVERLWTPRVVEEAWSEASRILWEVQTGLRPKG